MLKQVTVTACIHPPDPWTPAYIRISKTWTCHWGGGGGVGGIGDRLIKKGKEKNRREKMERNSQEGVKKY